MNYNMLSLEEEMYLYRMGLENLVQRSTNIIEKAVKKVIEEKNKHLLIKLLKKLPYV